MGNSNGHAMGNSTSEPVHEIEPHELMRQLIPDRKVKIAATMLGTGSDLVYKWRKETPSDENPNGTGAPNPIERIDRIFDFAFSHAPEAVPLLCGRYPSMYENLFARLVNEPIGQAELELKLSGCLREVNDVLALAMEGAESSELRKRWETAKTHIEEVVRRKERVDR